MVGLFPHSPDEVTGPERVSVQCDTELEAELGPARPLLAQPACCSWQGCSTGSEVAEWKGTWPLALSCSR